MSTDQLKNEYAALKSNCGLVRLPRTILEFGGEDRAAFLHNLCTNDIKKLAAGEGCEAFLTDVKGKTIGHAIVGAEVDSIWVDAVAGQSELLMPHFDRYIIMDDVLLFDRTEEWADILLAGPNASTLLRTAFDADTPTTMYSRTEFDEGIIRRVPFTSSDTFLLTANVSVAEGLAGRLVENGAEQVGLDTFEIARVEAFFPWFGKDFNADNLPQEIDRDTNAISFTKGCYLGQETVARIDAIGHVNRKLVRVKVESDEAPRPGSELMSDGKSVGTTCSSVISPNLGSAIAIALLKCDSAEPGTKLNIAGLDAIVL